MFGERLRKANRIAARRLKRRHDMHPYWYSRGANAYYLNRKLRERGFYRKYHGKNDCPEGPCTWCRNAVKVKGWWKERNVWIRDIDERFAWPQNPAARDEE